MELHILVNTAAVMQGVQTLLIGTILFYLYFTYRKDYLLLWAWSWIFYSVYFFVGFLGFELSQTFSAKHPYRLIIGFIYLTAGFLQFPLLLLGCYGLAAGKPVSQKLLRLSIIVSPAVGAGLTIATAFLDDPNLRFILRVMSHSFLSGAAFLAGAYIINRVDLSKYRPGKTLVLGGFLAYGTYQFLYTSLPFVRERSAFSNLLFYYILIESFLLFWIGLGLIIWLLEEERERATAAGRALQASAALFRQLTESNAAGILILQDNAIRYVNQTAARMLEYDESELQGQTYLDLFHSKYREIVRSNYEKLLTGIKLPRGEAKVLTKSGKECWIEATGARIEYEGKPAVLVTTIDVSEQKEAREQLLQSQKLESIGMLAGGVAHDFNNMLTGIIGFTELSLHKLPSDHQIVPNLNYVMDLSYRAADLTKQLLAFARRQILAAEVLDLNATVKETIVFLRRVIGEDIEIKLSLSDDLRPIKADGSQIHQVITNLALNARDAMPDGGALIISTRNIEADLTAPDSETAEHIENRSKNRIELTITDTGQGMNPEMQARIFEPFFTTKEMGRGTGLGLAIVYGIIKQHKGTITVESVEGKGTTFRILLPAVQNEAAQTGEKTEHISVRGGETILLAEDEASVRDLMREILSENGYQVIVAADGIEALEIFKKHGDEIKLVITDAMMPKLGGEQVFKSLRQSKPDLCFLFISGYGLKICDRDLTHNTDLLPKPFNAEALLQKVQKLLSQTTAS